MKVDLEKIEFKNATLADLPEIVFLLADDELGKTRESPSKTVEPSYVQAFEEIAKDPNNEIIVGKLAGKIIAVMQITYIANLTFRGSRRALIEGVRVSTPLRANGIGRRLFEIAFAKARAKGCKIAQLTSNKTRKGAFRFYEVLGLKATHEGFKYDL